MTRTAANRARIGLEHVRRLRRHISRGPKTDELIFDAVAMRLSAAIEEVSPTKELALVEAFGESWWEIKAMRNVIAHNYAYVDEQLLINSIEEDLDAFEAGLNALCPRES